MIFTPPRFGAWGYLLFCKNLSLRDVEDVPKKRTFTAQKGGRPMVAPTENNPLHCRGDHRSPASKKINPNKTTVCHFGCLFFDSFAKIFLSCFPFLVFPTSFYFTFDIFQTFFEKTLYFFRFLCYHMG